MTTFSVPVRWQDLDALGHVSHAVFLSYFEEQRDRWLNELLSLDGTSYVVARVEIDYEAAVTLEDGPVVVTASCVQIGRSSLTIAAEMRSRGGELCATSRTVIVLWDAEACQPRTLAAHERSVLTATLIPDDGLPRAGTRT